MKSLTKAIKRRWINYLNRLAKVNSDLYGSKRMDCCDLENKSKK